MSKIPRLYTGWLISWKGGQDKLNWKEAYPTNLKSVLASSREALYQANLLFTIYTDEIRSQSNCSVLKYGDDTAISARLSKFSYNVDQSNCEAVVSRIVRVCEKKNLLLNPKKSKEIIFENSNIKHEAYSPLEQEKL